MPKLSRHAKTARSYASICRAFLAVGLVMLFFGFAAVAQQPETKVAPPEFARQLQDWQKVVDDAEKKTAVGPLTSETINEIRERLKGIRARAGERKANAAEALKSQNELLKALGPAPEEGSDIKEDEKVAEQRKELARTISELDAEIKQADLLSLRIDKIIESFGKEKTRLRQTLLLQRSTLPLAPETLNIAMEGFQVYVGNFKLDSGGTMFLLLSVLLFAAFYRSLGGIRHWFENREIIVASRSSAGLYLHMLLPGLVLFADRIDVFGFSSSPVFGDVLRLVAAVWLSSVLFLFLYSISIHEPGEGEDDGGVPLGFLRLLLSFLRLAAFALVPVALYGYVQLTAYISLNLFAALCSVSLFIAVRNGIIGLNARFGRLFKREKLLSPLAVAMFEPLLALIAFLFAANFWGLTPGDVKEWAERYRSGVTIGSIHLDFSDLGAAVGVFFGLYLFTKAVQLFLAKRLFPQTHMNLGVQDAVYTLIGYIGVIVALLAGLGTLGLDMEKFALIAGALSVGIGFGLQAVVSNFVSGLILLFERPIRVGDFINVGTDTGTVKKIRVRSTELETLQFASIVVPNSKLISETVTNWTLSGRSMRVEVKVGVAYGSDTALVRKILMDIALDHPQVRKRPEPNVLFMGFGESSLDFELRCFIRDINERFIIASDLRFAIDAAFRLHGVEIPFPQRDVHIKESTAKGGGIVTG